MDSVRNDQNLRLRTICWSSSRELLHKSVSHMGQGRFVVRAAKSLRIHTIVAIKRHSTDRTGTIRIASCTFSSGRMRRQTAFTDNRPRSRNLPPFFIPTVSSRSSLPNTGRSTPTQHSRECSDLRSLHSRHEQVASEVGNQSEHSSEDDSDQRARYFRMFSAWPFQPLEFMLNAFARRDSGMASKPDSTMVSCVPPPASSSVNDTSVVGSAE